MAVLAFQLLLQNGRVAVAVGGSLLKAVIFLHGLVVQVFPVYHEQHLVHIGQLRGQLCRLKGSQCLTASGRVPDIAACVNGPHLFIISRNLDPVQYPLGGRDLIRPHHQQQILRSKHAIARQNVQQGML
jgi:hypothetical protein